MSSLQPHPPSSQPHLQRLQHLQHPAYDAHSDVQLDAAHEQIQRQLQQQQPQQQGQQGQQHAMITPHPPTTTAVPPANGGGRSHRHSNPPRPVMAPNATPIAATPAAAAPSAAAAAAGGFVPSQSPQQPQSQQSYPSATPNPGVPLEQESLPYHRKRLLELVDPATYEEVLVDTARSQLGFELAHHPNQRWIVEALWLAPLPQGVVRCYDSQGRAYYFDERTQSSSWSHPCAKQFESLLMQSNLQENAAAATAAAAQQSALPPTPKRKQHHQEEKSNHNDGGFDSASDGGSDVTTSPKPAHSKSFLRSNAGLNSTSSLFLTEEELAHWNDEDTSAHRRPPPPRKGSAARNCRATQSSASGAWIDDELGGRDGERWVGEDGEERTADQEALRITQANEHHANAAHIRASSAARARTRASRPSSAFISKSSVAAAAAPSTHSSTRSWNSQQPAAFHPWSNARGTGETEHLVPHPGSLIAPAPFAPIISLNTSASAATTRSRPSSGVRSRPTSAFHHPTTASSAEASFRAAQSAHIRRGHKLTRKSINGSMREKASHLYTLRATLLTKLQALHRLKDGELLAEEKSWQKARTELRSFAAVTAQRTHLFRLAFPMLDESDAHALGKMLHRSSEEIRAAEHRVAQVLLECSALAAQVDNLSGDLSREIQQTSESLKVEAQCLELARNGMSGGADSFAAQQQQGSFDSGASSELSPSTSLPRIHELLNLVLHFQTHARTHGSTLRARLVSEKNLLSELARANQIVLRRGCQHAAERREKSTQILLTNKASIPGLISAVKDLQTNLRQQMDPLAVCQRTYELRRGDGGSAGGESSMQTRDENLELLQRLEDELAALTTLVAHLESELALTQSQLAQVLETDRMVRAEVSTEEVRAKFYKNALAVQPTPSHQPLIRMGSTAPGGEFATANAAARPRGGGGVSARSHSQSPSRSRSRSPTRGGGGSSSRGASPSKAAHPSVPLPSPDGLLYRQDGVQVGSYLHSYNPEEKTPYPSQQQQQLQWGATAHAPTPSPPPFHPHAPSSRPASSKSYMSGSNSRPSSSASHRLRPASAVRAPSPSPLSAAEQLHQRNQLVRDQASNLERLRTRKVRRAKVAQGAAMRQELLVPNAGRPVFEGGANDKGYES